MSNVPKTSDSSSSNNLEKKPDKSEPELIIINDPSDSSVEAVPERSLAFECRRCDKKFAGVHALSGHQNAHKPKPPALQRCGWERAMLSGVFDPRFYGASASGVAVPVGPMQPVAYTGKPICMSPLLQTMTHGPSYSYLVPPQAQAREPNWSDVKRFSLVPVVNPTMTHGPFYSYLVPPQAQAREPNWSDFKRFPVVPVVNPTMTHGPSYGYLVPPQAQAREPNWSDFKRFPVVNPIQACASKGDQFVVNGPETGAPCGSRASQSDESGMDLSLKLSCALFNGGTTKRFDFEERDDSGLDLSLKL